MKFSIKLVLILLITQYAQFASAATQPTKLLPKPKTTKTQKLMHFWDMDGQPAGSHNLLEGGCLETGSGGHCHEVDV